jgi:hypothetical protein
MDPSVSLAPSRFPRNAMSAPYVARDPANASSGRFDARSYLEGQGRVGSSDRAMAPVPVPVKVPLLAICLGRSEMLKTARLRGRQMAWQRLSRRDCRKPQGGLHEGIPPHLTNPIVSWIADLFPNRRYEGVANANVLRHVATMNEIAIRPGVQDYGVLQTVLDSCVRDQDLCLDVVDCLLHFRGTLGGAGVEELSLRLTVGRSVWDTAADGYSLVRRTDPTASEQF